MDNLVSYLLLIPAIQLIVIISVGAAIACCALKAKTWFCPKCQD